MTPDELKEALNGYVGQPFDEEAKVRLKELFKQYVYDCKLVKEDPDLKSIKKELGIKDDPNIVEIEISVPINMVTIDFNIQTAEESRKALE